MKTRYLLTVFLSATGVVLAVGGCSPDRSNIDPNVEARLRNNLPAACTAEQIKACPAVSVTQCPNGQEPVIDYSSDCCPHFTCQPLCSSAQQKSCPMTPAPACPAGTKLWIGTAVEDCCPAYRCEPDGTTCDPTRHDPAACTLALPYCGPNVQPVIVGETADCCPVYQCPCPVVTDPAATSAADGTSLRCGCTTPNCKAGEEVVCDGKDVCGGPCTCQPAHGVCTADTDCSSDARCDLSSCRLPPVAARRERADLRPDEVWPAARPAELRLHRRLDRRSDRSLPAERRRKLRLGDPLVPVRLLRRLRPNIQSGCKADTDCPTGQACQVTCSGWGCGTGATGTGRRAARRGRPPIRRPGPAFRRRPARVRRAIRRCVCDAVGNCKGQTCEGQCVPAKPTCDPNNPKVCPTFAPVCPDGATPIPSGTDPNTCCQTYTCPTCVRSTPASTTGGTGTACPAVSCPCAKQVGTDPASCCPKYECGPVNADGTCA